MVALGNQGLKTLGEVDCWLILVGGSGIVGFIEPRVGCRWFGERLVTEEVCEGS